MQPRLVLAIGAGKIVGFLSQRLRLGGGTTLPGDLTRKLAPTFLSAISARLENGSIVVTGTNGKTTTSRMISNILRTAGHSPVHNRAGANLIGGIASAVLKSTSVLGKPAGNIGLFEVDEAVFPVIASEVMPRVTLMTNLFRDQLDRYGEVDHLAKIWRQSLKTLGSNTTVALNADDPTVASLGQEGTTRVLYFGLDDECHGSPGLQHTADARYCTNCGSPLEYPVTYYGHIGKYRCTKCDLVRPTPQVVAKKVRLDGVRGSQCEIETPQGVIQLNIKVPGLYNVYNALAAITAALAMDIPTAAIVAGIESFTAAFGRLETVQIDDKTAFLALVKNPVGFNEVLRTLLADETPKAIMIIINDNLADGTDISWLWDVDFELLRGKTRSIVVSGTRAEDMAVRLKYAGIDDSQVDIHMEKDLAKALAHGLSQVPAGETLYIMPTYTSMLEIREVLQKSGYVGRFWQD